MIRFTKDDLQYSYDWMVYSNHNPKVSGKLDSTKFNRNEGHEVVYFINKLLDAWDLTKMESLYKIEYLINQELPATVRTQQEAATWIQIHWKTCSMKQPSGIQNLPTKRTIL